MAKKLPGRLCIVTLDPSNGGGILSVMKFVYKQAEKSELEPYLAYNTIPSLRDGREVKDVTMLRLLQGIKAGFHKEEFDGMRGIGVERVLPEFEFFNYVLNKKQWKETLGGADVYFAVCGSSICALPLVLLNKKFSLWVATSLLGDRIDRIKQESFLKKIRDLLSLPFLLYFEKLVFKKAERILALSEYTKRDIAKKYGLEEAKINVAYFPINVDLFHPINFEKRNNDYILFTGRINDERKNIPLILQALAEILKKKPRLKLVLIGGKAGGKLISLVKKLGIDDSVEFIKFVSLERLVSYYQNAALFVIPSFQEGLCISGLEALACGVPVISTRCGGPEDFVKDSHNGYLVKNNDVDNMAKAIAEFLDLSLDKRQEMADNARNYILEHHSIDKIWPKFLKCFHEL